MTSPAIPAITIDTLLTAGRALLLDPVIGPMAESPFGDPGGARLRDVRVRGKPSPIGTMNWQPGETGLPFALLSASKKRASYKETGRVWEDWSGALAIALARDFDGTADLEGWAREWEAVMQQWFPLHRRFGTLGARLPSGDVYWEYQGADLGPLKINGVTFLAVLCHLQIHNVALVTWDV